MVRTLALAATLASACSASDEPQPSACGDQVCDEAAGENTTCPMDCHYCPACGPLATCVERICFPRFVPGRYTITATSATIPATHPDGSPWDPDGLPDPYITVSHGQTVIGTTRTITDTATPPWNEALATAVTLDGGDQLHFDLYDQDGATSELIASCSQPVDQPFISIDSGLGLAYSCVAGPTWIYFNLAPQ